MIEVVKKWHYWAIGFIILNIFLSLRWLINDDIRFDVDISRDFLLIKEIITQKPITLIGSHTSISGVFHGPLWYYLNVPAFFISSGNPVLIGWFWWGLSILTLAIIYFISLKLFNKSTALLATLLYSANSIINPNYGLKMFFPPYGAVMLFPIFFYLFIQYIFNKKVKYLAFAILILGFIIQFEMAFGIPILGLMVLFLVYFLSSRKLLKHFLILPLIFLPLSTFIIFEIRHNFLQIQSLIGYFESQLGKNQLNLYMIFIDKIRGIFTDTFFLLMQDNRSLSWTYSILFVILISRIKSPLKKIYWMFLFFYLGYWVIHLSLKPLWSSYYWPLLTVIIILYAGFINFFSKKIFILFFIPLLLWNMYIGLKYIKDFEMNVSVRGKNSWAFNELIARTVFEDADSDFGYFIFMPERWVFQGWYALDFLQSQYPQRKAHPFAKQKLTYLIIYDSPKDYQDPISMGWRITDLKITQKPKENKRIGNVEIQKYYLSEEELRLPVNPYLLNSTFFR
ncbi:MAG: hypothetical protein ACD_32C00109G0006 [uncultured bacterium]|uniref:Glycosyltransferase RgtA/B/C/D-like domain-containing protein n=1 Tax=Candidatus Daviesbacteria bacterium GW2011_GWC2_40_12 TaxID=1618431 RepID=A0A0G0TX70_9BACT|nr:MAG: hypothetical protein ACD_32C00109G0006 [uncultured bacterium]KKQ85057.1 MAG: hypothetical protein UT04_C0008G0005 [Candidatus Daviesbacteria bacterium GW2011_GWF2_38_7]KKR17178.1 MAG: hypothetical protein UT45_C0002G0007 [Candidatus Daviesbacteria bacterium GW2011_GWA2_39_33]KKR42577.1 MAG: hypothetical protein UT77_C0001G0028 [Candidatus Daviesbacteria bacterium GW2011_GWC2_40_12]OGE21253.1 MAG: hypothetical protein A2778_03750 [Candidatus Daviesbacteria bacterium RIFCSPHIGHO2_01_FULL_